MSRIRKPSKEYIVTNGLRLVLFLAAIILQAGAVCGQRPLETETDHWEGSSLGVRIEFVEGYPVVDEIHEHVQQASPFQVGDRIKKICLLYTSPSPRDQRGSRMPSSA